MCRAFPGCVVSGGILQFNPEDKRFVFEDAASSAAEPAKGAVDRLAAVMEVDELERTRRAVEAVGEATYHWIIETDSLAWSSNASTVLNCPAPAIASGKAYASFLDADNFTSRYDTVMRTQNVDGGEGVPYQIEYLFRPGGRQGREAIWVEDHGRWFAGPDGRPVEAYGAVRRIDDRHLRDQHLSFLGNCDPLTGMMNRGRMTEALGEAISVASREQGACAFLIAAVNNLPIVNEAYGYEVADEVIVAMGRRLRQVVRTGDGIARYSGSKFGIILNACDERELEIAVERFLSVARESVIDTQRGPVWAMLSVGAIALPRHASDANTAMARAEEALTEARRLPSDGYVVFRPSEKRSSERSLNARCATEIVQCLKTDRFKLAYQPIVSAVTGETVMHEALLRMADESGELIAAAHLIPVAEKLGLVRLIDRAVVQMTIAALHAHPEARLSINVSGTTATDSRWHGQLADIIAANAGIADRLTVEITETVALNDIDTTRNFVEKLRTIGCSVAIDDFGAGFTSFKNIRDLPINILKLDGSFCNGLSQNRENQYFVHALIELARKFELKTVAEWVEDPADADLLRSWNIDYMQGNLFAEAQVEPPWAQTMPLTFGLEGDAVAFDRQEPVLVQGVELPEEGPDFGVEPESCTVTEEAGITPAAPSGLAGPETAPEESAPQVDATPDSMATLHAAIEELRLLFRPAENDEQRRAG
jgi:diguanylate cyclase (GGDEF)-like protein